jgi:trimeric autotransporter adhesin
MKTLMLITAICLVAKTMPCVKIWLRRARWRRGLHLLAFIVTLASFGLSERARAVSPPPDGGYANQNTAEGQDALFSLTTGFVNTAVGFESLYNDTSGGANTALGFQALHSNTTGDNNTASGILALSSNTTGFENSAYGPYALFNNTTGTDNTASGMFALYSNTTGYYNTGAGSESLYNNTTGARNTASGSFALQSNTTGDNNTAIGIQALSSNTTGASNTAIGAYALNLNASGALNTASGGQALSNNATGNYNTADGFSALFFNTTGTTNTADGYLALYSNTTGGNNTATGVNALINNTTGNANIALGVNAGQNLTTGNNNIDIGNAGVAGESNRIRIGTKGTQQATFIAGISGKTVAGGVNVIIDSNGHLGTIVSSERFKDAIKPMDKASEAILALKPVTFRYKHELDPDGIPQFGLVAEQVEKVSPDLVARDDQGKPYTVRYEAVNAMLLNEFLKEHRTVQELKSTVAKQEAIAVQQQTEIKALTASLKEQGSQIQKVSDQLELSKPAPRTVVNNQ